MSRHKHSYVHRILYTVLFVVMILFASAALILHSQAFRKYALEKIIREAQLSTGMRIEVNRMELDWHPLTIALDGVAARNPKAITKEPLFSASRITVILRFLPLLHRRVQIDKVDIDAPIVDMTIASNGQSNLPTLRNTRTSDNSFEAQVALLIIRKGLIYFDDREIPLSAELRNFHGQVVLDRATNSYNGKIVYDKGRIETANVRTFEHAAELHFAADATHCVVQHLDLSVLHSRLSAQGELSDYGNPAFTGNYQGQVSGEDLRWITKNASIPMGDFVLKGAIAYRSSQGETFFDRAYVNGNLQSASLIVPAGQARIPVKAIQSTYRLERGYLYVDELRAEAFGGRVASESDVINVRASGGRVQLAIRGASVQQASKEFVGSSAQTVEVTGSADVNVAATWKDDIRSADVRAHAMIRSPNGASPSKGLVPVDGEVDVDYDAARDRASFRPSTIRTKSAQLHVNGVLSKNSTLNVHLAASDLHELGKLVADVTPANRSNPIAAYDLQGSADFTGTFSGAVKDPHIEGQVSGTDLRVEGTSWRTLHMHLAADARSLKLDDGSLTGSQEEQISFNGSAELANWSFNPEAPLLLQTRFQNVSATEIQQLGKTSYPVSGVLNGELVLSGSERSPVGHGHIDLVQAIVWNEPLNAATLDFSADKKIAQLNAQLHAPAGALTTKATYDLESHRYQAQIHTQDLKLEQVHILQQSNEPIIGELTADFSGSGSFDDPQFTGRAQIPSIQVRGETFKNVDAHVSMQHRHADLTFQSVVETSSLQVKGSLDLSGAYPAKLDLDTGDVPIGPLLGRFMPGRTQGVAGQLEVHVHLDGPLKDPAQIEGQAEISKLSLHTNAITLSSANNIKLGYHAGVLELASAELKGNGTDIRVNGSYPIRGTADMNLAANGTLDLKLLRDWTDGGHSSGQVNLELSAKGTKSKPVVQGRVLISNAIYTSQDLPVGIESLNGEISIDGNRLQISKLSGTAGGGQLSVGGSAVYGENSSFNLGIEATSVRVRQSGVRAIVDASLSLSGLSSASTLGGNITIHKLSFNQGADLASIAGQFSNDNAISSSSNFTRNMKLNVTVQSAEDLDLASSQISIGGSANLNAIGTVADPVILGRVTLTSGEIFFLGKRFEIQNGTIEFANTVRSEPVVSLYVKTVVDQYNITVNLTGPLDRLKSSYTSDPALSTADIINLLAFGQTTADAASNAATPASVAAESAVASAAGSQVASQVQKITGISQLTLNPLAGNNENPGSQIAIQQRVSGNVLLTFSTDVTSSQNQTVQVQYQVKRNVSISVLRDEYGGYGVDVRYHKSF
jgi:translocation and assembly module TamB